MTLDAQSLAVLFFLVLQLLFLALGSIVVFIIKNAWDEMKELTKSVNSLNVKVAEIISTVAHSHDWQSRTEERLTKLEEGIRL